MKMNFYITECEVYGILTVRQLTGARPVHLGLVCGWEELGVMMPDVSWLLPWPRPEAPFPGHPIAAVGVRQEASL